MADDDQDEPTVAREPDDGHAAYVDDYECATCGTRPERIGAWGPRLPVFCSGACEAEYFDDGADTMDDDEDWYCATCEGPLPRAPLACDCGACGLIRYCSETCRAELHRAAEAS